jgi:hypothetical protein
LRGDQCPASAGHCLGRSVGPQRLADGVGAFDKQLQMLGEELGIAGIGRNGKGPSTLSNRPFAGKDDAACRVVGLGKFRGGVQKGAAAPFRMRGCRRDHVEDRFELTARLAGARRLGIEAFVLSGLLCLVAALMVLAIGRGGGEAIPIPAPAE